MTTFVEFRLLDPDLQTDHGILPFQKGDLFLQLNEPGSGSVKTALDIASAALVESGGFIEAHYRDAVRGGFFVENLGEAEVNAQEGAGRSLEISGRGALALLEDAIVWSDGTGSNKRVYSGTQAGMLIELIQEAQTRGGLANIDYDFTDTEDSDEQAWTDDFPLELTVGMSLLDVIRQIAKTGIDFNILPDGSGNYILSAYKDGIGSNKSATVYFRVGVNCEEVSHSEAGGGIRNALLVKYKNGYTSVQDAGSIAARRRRESALNYDFVQRPDSAGTFANAELQNKKDPRRQISVKVYDGAGPRAFVDYVLGDTITLDRQGVEAEYRIRGIHLSWTDNELAEVIVDLNSMILENEIRITQDLDWLLNEWKTAHDAGLLEVKFWAAIGDRNITYSVNNLLIADGFLYVANYNDYSLLAYDLDGGGWTRVLLPLRPVCLANIGSDIYIGAGNKIYKYSGGTITTVGTADYASDPGITAVLTMTAIGSNLFCSGILDSVDAVPITGVAKLSGGAWTDIGGGSATETMITDGTNIFAAFGTAVKEWNGSSWTQLGSSFSLAVLSLAVFGTKLLAGNAQAGGIFLWDGVSWTTFGGGVNGAVYAIGVYLTDVYIGGTFIDVGSKVARHSGGSWWELEEGCNNTVTDIVMDGEDLYVGGPFTTAGDKNAQGIAAYFNNFDSLADYLENSEGTFNLGEAIHNAVAKTSLTGADEMPLWDSVSQALRKITWTNIIASIKTWADTIYVALTGDQTVAGVKTFSSFPITPSSAPTTDYQAANKKYVDDNVGGGGTPGGSDGSVQYNNEGSFGGFGYWDDTLEQLWIGGLPITAYLGKGLGIIGEGGVTDVSRIRLFHFGTQTSGAGMTTAGAGGTRDAPTATTNGTVLGQWGVEAWYADAEASHKTIGYIRAIATAAHSAGSQPFKWEIYTCPSGSDAPVLVATFGSDGQITYHNYGAGTFEDTPEFFLGVDVNGKIIEIDPADVGGGNVESVTGDGVDNTDPANPVLTFPTPADLGIREVLAANRTYYVRTDGNDSNDGLANTSGGAFLTVQKAVDIVSALDIAGYTVTIQIADGTYTGGVNLKNVSGFAAPGNLVIQGNNGTPANVVISPTSDDCFYADSLYSTWDIKDMKLQTTTGGSCLVAENGSTLRFYNLNFGACASMHMVARYHSRILAMSNYAVSGGATAHINGNTEAFLSIASRTITFSNSPVFTYFAISNYASVLHIYSMTFTNGGTVTGTRYVSQGNSVIYVNGGGANYLPGNAAGSTANGGQYY